MSYADDCAEWARSSTEMVGHLDERYYTKTGRELTDDDLEALADEAEKGYTYIPQSCTPCLGFGKVPGYQNLLVPCSACGGTGEVPGHWVPNV